MPCSHGAAQGCCVAPGMVSSGGEQRGSVLSACKGARKPAWQLWAAEPPQGADPFLCPCTCKSSAFQSSPWRPMSNVGCLRLLERGGLGGLPILLHAWQWVR